MSKVKSQHAHMSPADRAKQFMPFAALKGYEEALSAMEEKMEAICEKKSEPFLGDTISGPSDTL